MSANHHWLINVRNLSTGARSVVADLRDRPQKICNHISCETSCSANLHDQSQNISVIYVIYNKDVLSRDDRLPDDEGRPEMAPPHPFPASSESTQEFAEESKLGFGFTPSDELEAVDIGTGDRPRLTWVSKKLDPEFKAKLVELLREFPDCFA